MIEILFNDSAAGSLKMAYHYGKGTYSGSCISVIISHSDGSKPTKAEIRAAQRKAEEKRRLAWENAVPLDGNHADIFCFNLALSVGGIAEDQHTFINRRRVLERLFSIYPEDERDQAVREILKAATENLEAICKRAAAGEPIRIWYSNQPDEMCGLYWLMSRLEQWDVSEMQVVTVKLPDCEEDGENIVQFSGWGEVPPEEWRRYFKLQKSIPSALIKSYAFHWRELEKENAPLRAVLNGRLVSAPESLYDHFIFCEIEAEDDEFHEAQVIGRVLGKYQLGIGDAWVALRIEEMIQAGKLKIVSHAAKDMPIYRRMLKKCT